MESNVMGELSSGRDNRSFESGRYRALARLGEGGMADVFLAVARGPAGFNKLVVIKRLKDALASQAAYRDMFLDEARLAARLSHPNVVQTYEVTEEENLFFMTMEYLDGQPLSRLMSEITATRRKVHPAIHARLVAEALAGLHYVHELKDYNDNPLKIVHRDVSPQNICVTYDGQVKVLDFGIAKTEVSSNKTQAGTFKGNVSYMAPEQLMGEGIDRRVDIFTTGVVLWELLTGQRLLHADTPGKTLMRVVKATLPRVCEVVPDIDPELDAIVMRALERDLAARYQTAKDMRDELERYIARSGFIVRREDVVSLMDGLFANAREKTRARLNEKMALALAAGASSGSMPCITRDGMSLPVTGITGMRSSGSLEVPAVHTPQSQISPSPAIAGHTSRWTRAAFGLACIGVAASLYSVRMKSGPSSSGAPPPAESTLPVPAVSVPRVVLPPVMLAPSALTAQVPVATGAPPVDAAKPPAAPPARASQPVWRPAPRPAPAPAPLPPAPVNLAMVAPEHPPATPPVAQPAAPVAPPQARKIRTDL